MNQKIIVRVSPNQDLEFPQKIKSQLQPNSEYEMTFNQDEIILKKIPLSSANFRQSSGKSLLRHTGTWKGDDFEECLQSVYENRSQVEI